VNRCVFVGHAQNKPKKQFKKINYKQRNTLKLEVNGIWKKQNIPNNWNCNLKKFVAFPHLHKIEEGGVVTIWRAKKNQRKEQGSTKKYFKRCWVIELGKALMSKGAKAI